ATGISPIIENLASQDVPAYAPDTLPPLAREPLVPDQLCVHVGDLVRSVVNEGLLDVRLRTLHEKHMVVGILLAEVQVHERQHVHVREVPVVENVGRYEVEIVRIPCQLPVEVRADVAK